ncbi:MAG: hypothetical protein U9Q33_05895 [Campylobacterota bacterium]|nr:hypothetical protein [Campylobacterota bacterium]
MNIENEIFSIRKEQASELDIDHAQYESLESLEDAIASKLAEGMEPLTNILELIENIDHES